MLRNVFREVSAGHPHRDKLKGSGSDAEEGDDVWVVQAFPHHCLLIERLWFSSVSVDRERDRADNVLLRVFLDHPWSTPGCV